MEALGQMAAARSITPEDLIVEILRQSVPTAELRAQRRAALEEMRRFRIKLPPGAPSSVEMIREDRDR